MEYMGAALGVWFLGFVPVGELLIAVPAALAAGLDDVSAIFWTVFGNLTPLLIIHFGFEWLMRVERIRGWLTKLVNDKAKARFDKWGIYFILLATPWTGVWAMGVTAKALRIEPHRFITAACASIFFYALGFVILLRLGASAIH